jgi:hypothetical protein
MPWARAVSITTVAGRREMARVWAIAAVLPWPAWLRTFTSMSTTMRLSMPSCAMLSGDAGRPCWRSATVPASSRPISTSTSPSGRPERDWTSSASSTSWRLSNSRAMSRSLKREAGLRFCRSGVHDIV